MFVIVLYCGGLGVCTFFFLRLGTSEACISLCSVVRETSFGAVTEDEELLGEVTEDEEEASEAEEELSEAVLRVRSADAEDRIVEPAGWSGL